MKPGKQDWQRMERLQQIITNQTTATSTKARSFPSLYPPYKNVINSFAKLSPPTSTSVANDGNVLHISDFVKKYSNDKRLESGSRLIDEGYVAIPGRVSSQVRESSKTLFFFNIERSGHEIQIISENQHFINDDKFTSLHRSIRHGDVISVYGFPARSKKGELSLVPKDLQILSPCIPSVPYGRSLGDGKDALRNVSVRLKERHVDLLVRGHRAKLLFEFRADIINYIRSYLNNRGFLEVETPILQEGVAGGAAARPFVSKSERLHKDFKLRISPELYLKRLLVGGFDRVYEIGKVFRNEGLSPVHNPEFTMCEFYQAFATVDDLMDVTEELLCGMAVHLHDKYNGNHLSPLSKKSRVLESLLKYANQGDVNGTSSKKKFRRISIIEELQRMLAISEFPNVNDESNKVLKEVYTICKNANVPSIPNSIDNIYLNVPQLLDKLIGHVLEPLCVEPTFLIDHPVCMSPLAKGHPTKPGMTERFELFIAGKEVCNSYSELNDPAEQRERFSKQHKDLTKLSKRQDNDENPNHEPDEDFCEALEYGLPPTAGWVMGVDRMVMLLSGEDSIKETILFPIV